MPDGWEAPRSSRPGLELLLGYTALPRRIDVACPVCGAVFSSITDRKELKMFRYRDPRPGER